MWLMTPFGFFSVVQKASDKLDCTVTVRARVKRDLEELREKYLPDMGEIYPGGGSDYQYRIRIRAVDWALALSRMGQDIDYDNFKEEVARRQGKSRAQLYHRIWKELWGLPDSEPELSYGAILLDAEDKVLLRKPKGEFDGYVWTFPKGRPKQYEPDEDVAHRQLLEKTGYRGYSLGKLPGRYVGGSCPCEYFLMRLIGSDSKTIGCDSQELSWVPLQKAGNYIEKTTNEGGRARDMAVWEAAMKAITAIRAGAGNVPNRCISRLFDVEPEQWGLRGDVYLWRDMKRFLSKVGWPSTCEEFQGLIMSVYLILTGRSMSEKEDFFVEKYSHGGMSSGFICPSFWNDRALALLQSRYEKMSAVG